MTIIKEKSLFKEGIKFFCSDEYEKAMDNFIKVTETDKENIEAFICWREAANKLCYYNSQDELLLRKVCNIYEEINKKYQRNVDVLIGWGYALYKLYDIKKGDLLSKALEKYEKANEIDSNNAIVHLRLGDIYSKLGYVNMNQNNFIKSINEFKMTYNLILGDIKPLYRGTFIEFEKTLDENIKLKKQYKELRKAIGLSSNYVYVFGSWGRMLLRLANLKRSKTVLRKEYYIFDNITKGNDSPYILLRKCILSLLIDRKVTAKKYFENSKQNILQLFALLNDENPNIINENIFLLLLDSDLNTFDSHFFYEIIENNKIDRNNLETYKKAYILSNIIISKLHVQLMGNEKYISHYSSVVNSKKILFYNNEKLKLNAINYSNDPTEGKILLEYLYKKEDFSNKKEIKSEYGIFAGCFTFSYDSLNQFRLYGKEDDKEGVGLSLMFKYNFFHEAARLFNENDLEGKTFKKDEVTDNKQIINSEEKFALFRCIYIDPDGQSVVTVGQKEDSLFYKERSKYEDDSNKNNKKEIANNKEGIKNEIEEYNISIKELINFLEIKFTELKIMVEKLNPEIIDQLFINLRYLVKHSAFKEEQECRIIKICRLDNKEVELENNEKIYYKYSPDVSEYIYEIYFGPKATGMEIFQDILTKKGINILCKKSKNPLA